VEWKGHKSRAGKEKGCNGKDNDRAGQDKKKLRQNRKGEGLS
jgi:hypothetical protein